MKKLPLILIRCLLSVLILFNIGLIFNFSEQEGTESGKVSLEVSTVIAQTVVKDFEQKPTTEQNQIVQTFHLPVRKLAHMAEFGMLGLLIFTLLLTWKGFLWLRWLISLTSVFAMACLDEWHQSFTKGRHAAFTDVLIDLSGALITCTLLILCILLARFIKQKKERKQDMI